MHNIDLGGMDSHLAHKAQLARNQAFFAQHVGVFEVHKNTIDQPLHASGTRIDHQFAARISQRQTAWCPAST